MDHILQEYLSKNNIKFIEHKHPAVFTVAESSRIAGHIPGKHAKNLFLKDEKGRFYLYCLPAEKRADLKKLGKILNARHLSFGSPEELKKELSLTPGSVSIFGMIHAKKVALALDSELWNAEKTGFHPNVNTSTLELDHENLRIFYDSLSCRKEIVEVE